jgi:hypothetical protein
MLAKIAALFGAHGNTNLGNIVLQESFMDTLHTVPTFKARGPITVRGSSRFGRGNK